MFNTASILQLAETHPVATTGTAGENAAQTNPILGTLVSLAPLVLIFVVFYFFMIRPQRKKQKEEQKMRDSLRVGDELITIGGIHGRVVSKKENTVTIETGADRTKMEIEKWAIQTVETKHDDTESDDDDDDDDDI